MSSRRATISTERRAARPARRRERSSLSLAARAPATASHPPHRVASIRSAGPGVSSSVRRATSLGAPTHATVMSCRLPQRTPQPMVSTSESRPTTPSGSAAAAGAIASAGQAPAQTMQPVQASCRTRGGRPASNAFSGQVSLQRSQDATLQRDRTHRRPSIVGRTLDARDDMSTPRAPRRS